MPESRKMSYIRAVNTALRWALDEVPETFIFGEDVAIPNGPFGATKGLHADYGDRVFDTPISESAMVGAALGAAMRGCRPVVEIMFMDFSLVAMDQIVNQIANTRYVSLGGWQAPLVIRTQSGHSPGSVAQHSQCLEAFFAHVPGLRIAAPARPQDAYDMLRSAVSCDDPVILVENRMLYAEKGDVSLDGPVEPIGGSRITVPGDDVTVVAWSRTVRQAEDAARTLADEGVSVEVIDLRWLSPLDLQPVLDSVVRTGRVVVAHEAVLTGGFGAEVATRITEHCFADLERPVERVATADVPIPAAPSLQRAVIPDAQAIVDGIRRTLTSPVGAGR